MKPDGWKLYCEAFRALFPKMEPVDMVSPAALQEMVERLTAVQTEAASPMEGKWECPANTVGKLISSLRTIPAETPFYTAYFIEIDGVRGTRTSNPSLSWETVEGGKVQKFDPASKCIVMWATAFQSPQASSPIRVVTDDDPSPYDLSDTRHPANRRTK